MENGNKLRLLYIYQYLLKRSDAEHPVSTPELLKYLKDEYNMDIHCTVVCATERTPVRLAADTRRR